MGNMELKVYGKAQTYVSFPKVLRNTNVKVNA